MNLLEIVQEFCLRRGLPRPTTVSSSADDQILQLRALLNEVLDDLATRRTWTRFQKEATWTSTAAEDQGAVTTLAPGAQSILNDTIWDRTENLPCYGPLRADQWQAEKAMANAGVNYQYRIREGRLLFTPALPAGHTMAFEYASPYLVSYDNNGTTAYREYFEDDEDEFLLSGKLILAGLHWKWKYEKGFKYAEEFRAYESMHADLAGRDGTRKVLNMEGSCDGLRPGVLVPNGNWSV